VCAPPPAPGYSGVEFYLMGPEGFTGRVLENVGEVEPAKQL